MPDIIARYQKLPAPERLIVRLLAIAYEPLSRSTIVNCLRRLEITSTRGIYFVLKTLTPVLDGLKQQGLILAAGNDLTLPPALLTHCSKEAMTNGTFLPWSEHILHYSPINDAWSNSYYFKRYPRFLRHLRYRLFTGDDWATVSSLINSAYKEFREALQLEHPLAILFNNPLDPEYIKLFPASIYYEVLAYLLYSAKMRLTPAEPLIGLLLECLPHNPTKSAAIHGLLAYYLALWGHCQEAQQHLDAIPTAEREVCLGIAGWLQTLRGQDLDAIAHFTVDHARIVKLNGKKKVFFEDISGVFYIISLLRTGDPAHLAKASQYLNLIDSSKRHPLQPYSPPLRQALTLCQGLPLAKPTTRAYLNYRASSNHSPASNFFLIMGAYWADKASCREYWSKVLADLRDRAQKAGQVWLASEAAELLARLEVDTAANRTLAAALRQKYQLASVIDAVQVFDPWERSLKALINLAAGRSKDKSAPAQDGESNQRLIWWLEFNEKHHSCELVPRLQIRNKSGNWSAGRAVALKTLTKDAATMAGLSDQDRAICAAIKVDYESAYSYGYYKREVYHFKMEAALNELVGHPLLFLADSNVRIDLSAGEPELLVTRHQGKIVVKMQPEAGFEADKYQLLKETPTRFKLMRFSPQHRAIAAILQKGLRAPGKAEQLTTQAIAALSSMITIHSDLEGGGANSREVPADPTPHLHLLPYQDGLKAEIMVRPLPQAEVWYRPGVGGQKVFAEVNGEKLHAARSLAQEKKLAAHIITACPALVGQEEENGEYLLPTPEEGLEFLLQVQELGEQVALEWPQGQSLRLRGQAQAQSLSLQIKQERDWFKASGSLAVDEAGVISLQALLGLLDQAKGRFVRLDDGSFLALTREFRNRLEELRAFGENHGDGIRFSPLAALGLEDLCQEAGEFQGDRHWKKHLARMHEIIDPKPPSTLQAELRDYQITGFKWLAQLAHWGVGACLADDMGLGKTVQALAALLRLAPNGPSLVVAPLSVLMNWQDEAQRFAPTLNVIMFGPGDRQQTLLDLQPFDLVISSYGLLQVEAEKLAQVEWQGIVLDEAQAIKNMNTKRAKAAMNLKAEFKVITTGTPVENHLGELWSLFDFITPGLLGSFKRFSSTFMSTVSPEADKKARARLKKLIQPFILRRLKSQVLQELPARTEITLRVEMGPDEAALYEAQRRSSLDKLATVDAEPSGQQQIRIFAEIMRLRRLCCNPSLVLPECAIESSKLKVFGELLDDILGNHHKALVFSQFVDHLHILARFLDKRGISYQYLDGSTPVATRKKRINDFQAGVGDVFLISLKAGGSGLNLTAADYVIHMDPWWNPAVEDQASDRAHRIGQQRPVTIYRLVMGDSIEEQIIKLHREKRDLADSLLSGGDLSGKMSASELLGLLKEAGL